MTERGRVVQGFAAAFREHQDRPAPEPQQVIHDAPNVVGRSGSATHVLPAVVTELRSMGTAAIPDLLVERYVPVCAAHEVISQHLRNQRNDEVPQLYAYAQLLLAISLSDGRYGTHPP